MTTALSPKTSFRRFVDEVWNEGRVERVGEFVSADYIGHDHSAGLLVEGRDGLSRLVERRRERFPGLQVRVDDALADEDLLAARWTATGVGGTWRGISVIRTLAGKHVESWTQWDRVERS
jgi:predicted SnoaL-like aldol condensation-catalyzing enzyme